MNRRFPDTLSYLAAVRWKDKIWCSNLNFNGLYAIDIYTGKVEFIGRFIGHRHNSFMLHGIAERVGERIYFFPQASSSAIDIYDCSSGMFDSCEIVSWKMKKRSDNFTCAIGAYVKNDCIFVFPRFLDMPLIKYSINKNEIMGEILLNRVNGHQAWNKTDVTIESICIENNVYFPIHKTNKVIRFDLERELEELIEVNHIRSIDGAIGFDGKYFWLNADGGIFKFDKSFNKIFGFQDCVSESERLIIRYVFHDEYVYAIPAWLGKIKRIHSSENPTLVEMDIDVVNNLIDIGPMSRHRNTGTVIEFRDKFVLNPINLKSAIGVCYDDFSISYYKSLIPEESFPLRDFIRNKIYYENGDLNDFIQFIKKNNQEIGASVGEESQSAVAPRDSRK